MGELKHITKNGIIAYTVLLLLFVLSIMFLGTCIDDFKLVVPTVVFAVSTLAHTQTLFMDFVKQRKMYRKFSDYYMVLSAVFIFVAFMLDISIMLPILLFFVSHLYRIQGNRLILPKNMSDMIGDKPLAYTIALNDVVYDMLFFFNYFDKEYTFTLNKEYMTEDVSDSMIPFIISSVSPYVDEVSVKNTEYYFYININYRSFESLKQGINKLKSEIDETERRIKE